MKKQYFLLLFVLVCTVLVHGGEKNELEFFRWELSLGGTCYYVSEANNWNFGPQLSTHYAFTNSKGIYLTISYPVKRLTSRGYGFREGFATDLGGWISPRGMQSRLKLGVGLSHIFGSDADGSQIRDTGLHISGQASHWFTRKLGVWGRGILRYWLSDRRYEAKLSPSFSVGIGFRF